MFKIFICLLLLTSCTKSDLKVVKIMPYNKVSAPATTSARLQVSTSKVSELNKLRELAEDHKIKILIYPDAGKPSFYNINLLGLSSNIDPYISIIKDDFPVQEIEK